MSIKFTRTTESNPRFEEYRKKLWDGTYSRQEAITEATALTGVKIYDIGNTSNDDLFYALEALVGRRMMNHPPQESNVMPMDSMHLVIGHAVGRGNSWCFCDTQQRVKDYVNQAVSNGEKAWVVACKTDEPRYIAKLEGEAVVSEGPLRTPITFRKV